MDCVACNVFPTSRREWMAQLENGAAGPFMSQDIALRIATLEALRLRRLNRAARVVVRTQDGAICAERCPCQQFGR